jgi:ubiquinone/menaquinone biosynthesis C-methylase UbiE
MLDEAAQRARRTYDAAADHYDGPALAFWSRAGTRTVERLGLPAGAAVLDAPCGSGASALPAARAVGASGSVVGADVAEGMLALARAKAEREGLDNAEFRLGDMRALGYPDESFDAVVSVFGIFFVPDMPALAAELWRMVRPGGVLAVTTWGLRAFDPGAAAFWEAVAEVRPELVRAFSPWDSLDTIDKLLELLDQAGIDGEAEAEDGEQPMRGPDDWWAVILGTGYRGTLDALSSDHRAHVERHVRSAMADAPPMRAPVVFGTARKGAR